MSSAPRKRYTVEEYLAREEVAERKSEYYRGEIFAMAGASFKHNLISSNLIGELHNRLRGDKNCRVLGSDQRLLVKASTLFTYPDVLIVCNPKIENESITNPKVIFEVLSKSTESYDRGKKFQFYRNIESLTEVILVSQEEARCERFVKGDDGKWSLDDSQGLDAQLNLAAIDNSIPLADIYRGVDFSQDEEGKDHSTLRLQPDSGGKTVNDE